MESVGITGDPRLWECAAVAGCRSLLNMGGGNYYLQSHLAASLVSLSCSLREVQSMKLGLNQEGLSKDVAHVKAKSGVGVTRHIHS